MNDQEILRHIGRQPKQTAGYKQLVRELGARGADERRELAQRLRTLVRRGELREATRDHFSLPEKARKGLVSGKLSMHPDGFGFVTPEDEALRGRISGDIFINPNAIGTAMHGDRVLVELGAIRPSGRAEGRIAGVIGRKHETVVGIFHYGGRNNYVIPIDEKITQQIVIPPGAEVPQLTAEDAESAEAGRQKKAIHRVLGEEAKKRARSNDLEGAVVDVEITAWPTPTQNPRGRVIENLGAEEDFGVDVEIIIRKYHLPHRFPAEVIEEAQSIPNMIARGEYERRRDFRQLPIVTIDGETARDFDDAVAVSRLANGNYQLQVHIADVAHYVRDGSELDREARLRGTSVYFPDRAVPMLPVELSTDICSLRPQSDRLVMSCLMEIDHRGEIAGYELTPGIIRSAARMTYTAVNAILDGDEVLRREYGALAHEFERMRELALILNRKRVRRGSIDFDLPEPVIEFDEQGLMRGVTRSERNIAHRIIEEFMLAANECVAGYLEQNGIPSLYRIHEKPDAKKVYDFETLAATFGYSLGVGALPIRRMQLRGDRRMRHASGRNPREIEIPQDVHVTPRMYQKLTEKIAGKPEERILSYLMLRSLKQARYSEKNEGHFALAAETYTHFTSPIRRYPDLIVHRILKEILANKHSAISAQHSARKHSVISTQHSAPKNHPQNKGGDISVEIISESELREIGEWSSETERRAADAERELIEWKQMKFMQQRLGEEFAGLVVSVTKYGLFVELEELFIEGLVPLGSLTDDRYTFRENTRQIIGERSRKTYSLGDRVRVIVDRIDRMQRKIQFALVEEEPQRRHRRRR
jgi:ribonuclease R